MNSGACRQKFNPRREASRDINTAFRAQSGKSGPSTETLPDHEQTVPRYLVPCIFRTCIDIHKLAFHRILFEYFRKQASDIWFWFGTRFCDELKRPRNSDINPKAKDKIQIRHKFRCPNNAEFLRVSDFPLMRVWFYNTHFLLRRI